MDNKELKVKSFRVNEETFSKFKDIASKEFGNQSQCLEALINIYETEESKSILVNRELEIESFQDYLNKISRLFITSLQLSTDAEERVKSTFLQKLESKDEAILIVKNKIDELKLENKTLIDRNKQIQKETIALKSKNEELEISKNTLTQLVNRNHDLADTYKIELDKLIGKQALLDELELEIKDLNNKIITSTFEKNLLEQDILKLKNQNEELMIKKTEYDNTLKEKNDEVKSYKLLIESIKRESKAKILANDDRNRVEFEKALKERIELIERGYELDKKELELKIKELKLNKKL